ncbi:MAG: type II toxin-antitoxin system Phd/YefM family antitoxin [Proteobacteria bacterium]|nr:type II toxin-antitoxin system Phd/YefM family antitoxin [Pseudomonadota bacterium]
MKTLTATEARQNLGSWLTRALNGEDIGIISGGKIVALRPVEVYSEDYALLEYGVDRTAMARAEAKVVKQLKTEKTTRWDGTEKSLRG